MQTIRPHAPRGAAWSLTLLPGIAALSACTVGPTYHRPTAIASPVYKENRDWTPATPRPIPKNQPWWSIYEDPELDSLERLVKISNQSLKASEAQYREALAVVGIDTGSLFPDIGIGGSGSRSGEAPGVVRSQTGIANPPYAHSSLVTVTATGSWTLDIWGRIRRQIESDKDLAQVSAADVAAAELSEQVTLAEDYFQMRAAEQEIRMYKTYLADLENALEIVQNEVRAGTDTLADVYAAQTQLENTQVSAINEQLTRATYEHAIAVLTGRAPQQLTIPEGSFATTIPVVPVGLPSQLLERRPDIAAAERTVASENALIGVAEAAWFPNLTLTGEFGFTSSKLAGLLSQSNSLWSFGPQLAETVFNGGARLAQNRQVRAAYDASVANYRQTVLTAFQSVENDLVTLRVLQQSDALNVTSVSAARLSEQLYTNQYKSGIVSYASVLTAQTTRLVTEITLLSIRNQQLVTSVDLVAQVGGGWDASELNLPSRGVPPPN